MICAKCLNKIIQLVLYRKTKLYTETQKHIKNVPAFIHILHQLLPLSNFNRDDLDAFASHAFVECM